MKKRNKNLLELRGMLCSIMAEYSSEITAAARKLPLKKDVKTASEYRSYSDEIINRKISQYRDKIYDALVAEDFRKMYPKMNKVAALPHSSMDKCIIFMIGMGLEPNEMARMLISDKRTIMTIRSKRKEDIQSIFSGY